MIYILKNIDKVYLNTDQIHKSLFMIKAQGVNTDFQELVLTQKERQEVINSLFQNETQFQKKINLLCQIPELN